MKKSILVVLAFILMISLTSCKRDIDYEINKRYMNLQSYYAKINVTITGNKGKADYDMEQIYQAPDRYKTEVLGPENLKGTAFITDGDGIRLRSESYGEIHIDKGVSEELDFMFLGDFLKELYSLGEIGGYIPNNDGEIVLNSVRSGKNSYHFTQSLYINADTYLPIKLITYDSKGNEIIKVEYREFNFNPQIDETAFLQEGDI